MSLERTLLAILKTLTANSPEILPLPTVDDLRSLDRGTGLLMSL